MARIMLTACWPGRFDANMAIALDSYVRQRLMVDQEWPDDYDIWDPVGVDWGWVIQSNPGTSSICLPLLMARHGFRRAQVYWGADIYLFTPRHLPPANLALTTPPQADCVICIEPLPRESRSAMLPCLHSFHRSCILLWLARDGRCPVCRQTPPEVLDGPGEMDIRTNGEASRHRFQMILAACSRRLSALDILNNFSTMRIYFDLEMMLIGLRLESWKHAKWKHVKTRAMQILQIWQFIVRRILSWNRSSPEAQSDSDLKVSESDNHPLGREKDWSRCTGCCTSLLRMSLGKHK